ncbi:LOW QUALITY PROTEIN: hypothetical protein MAR_021959 [Mya arenaria]|uniref:Uncharacterized protein n=1 Tax=Mya arenaria TaxID=6604 RepID=A0ABY7E986_MYAAR|nr:LOW QUALITY PROTEIN: hypothetical protein MAR_021959 [Mya arenaria]
MSTRRRQVKESPLKIIEKPDDAKRVVNESCGKKEKYEVTFIHRSHIEVFKKFEDSDGHLPIKQLRDACNAINLYPSTSQLHEMLLCAVEYGSPCKPECITFGEFCVLVTELQNYYRLNPKPPVPCSLIRVRSEAHFHRRKRRVFLGGSCNPTKWRAEIAIPYFKEHGITFYNPVQNWKPELMELEAQAKQMADILFFVIDSKTRAISSMIEVAYLVATNKQVVVTIEMLDLIKGRLILTDLVERNSVPIFADIHKALRCTNTIVTTGCNVKELTLADGARPVKHGHLKLGRALLELREAFNSVDSEDFGWLSSDDLHPDKPCRLAHLPVLRGERVEATCFSSSLSELSVSSCYNNYVCFAYKTCTGEEMDSRWLRQRRKNQDDFDYEEFCAIVTEYRAQQHNQTILQKILNVLWHPLRWLSAKFNSDEEYRDVYLGGSFGDSQWRSEIAIPTLRKHGLSYVDPSLHDWDQKLIPIHAGYYIGKGCRMVICVEKIPDNASMNGEQLSPCAIKDYNRGRDYLCDLASREGVPLFDNILEATNCVVAMLTDVMPSHPMHATPTLCSSRSSSQLKC